MYQTFSFVRYLAAALTLMLAACGDKTAPTLAQWKLVEEWRVGGDADGPHSFDFNLGLARLPRGGFVHYDHRSHKLHYLDAQGRALRSVGRRGNGPGEFDKVNGLLAAPDGSVIVSDLANGFLIFTDSGEFVNLIRPTFGRLGTGQRWDAFVFSDGQVVENVNQEAGQPGGGFLRVIWSPDLMGADTLPGLSCRVQSSGPATKFALMDSTGRVMAHAPLMHAEPDKATAFDHDGTIWEQRDPARSEIVRHNLRDCNITNSIKLPGGRAPLDSATRANMLAMATAEAKRWRASAPELKTLPTQRPWYQAINVDIDANVWVERIAGDGAYRVEIYTAEGKPVAEMLRTSLPVAPIITATHVYGMVPDKDDVRYLVSWRIDRQ